MAQASLAPLGGGAGRLGLLLPFLHGMDLAWMGSAAAATTSGAPPHLLLICFPDQGHVNPMLRLAKRIAAKGLLVTFSSVSTVGAKLATSRGVSAGGDGVALGRGRVRFEFVDDEDLGPDLDDLMRHLAKEGPPAFAKLLARQAAFRVG
ncbi:hypothetical protein SORBI_3005G073300 [Sorghum bicolor]|uniref:Uncharacterized protein n=1 Tax=Sorghum bicolor TaxID=4558 RepID=C5Y726_SORBI|nr:hypothetical protein SORBI_3005G073300 [Sorghum bicolor]